MSAKLVKSSLIGLALIMVCTLSYAQPTAQFTASPLSGCAPLVVNFTDQSTGAPTQWKWDLGNATISFLQHPSATYFNPGVYTVKLVVQNAAGKDSITKTQYITVFAPPAINFSATPTTGCFPLPVQFSDLSTAGSGTITGYLWDFGDGNTSTLQNPSHIYTAAGSYNISLRIINSNGCQKTLTRTNFISISSGALAAFTNTAPSGCSTPSTVNFQNQSTGTGTLNYQWSFGDGGTSTAINPSHIYTAAGSYNVQLIVINSTGCRDTIVHNNAITIGSTSASFNVPSTICAGTAITFTNTSSPTPVSASWNFGDATTSTSINPVKTYSTAGTYSVKLISNFGGCLDSTTRNVTVLPKPSASFTASPLASCSLPVTVNFNNNSTGSISYEWDFGDGGTSTATNPSHTYTAAGNYNITLVAVNANGCTDTLKKIAYIKIQLPSATLNNLPYRGCAPLTFTFSSTVSSLDPVVSYQWNFGDGNTSTSINPTHSFAAGVYDIQLIITTSTGCTDTILVPAGITATIKPVANFSATPTDVCANMPAVFTDLSTGTVTEWFWNFGDGSTSTQQNPSHQYQDTGLFDIMLVAGNNGCYDTIVFLDYIHVKPPIAIFNTITDCDFPLVRTFTDASIGADSWNWDFGDGNTSTLQNPVHTYAAAGAYTVTLLVRNFTTNCEYTKSITVLVADESANFTATQTTICRNSSTTFNAVTNNAGGISNFDWDLGDGTVATGSSVTHTYTQSGNYTVRLIITDIANCKDTMTRVNYIRVNGPVVNFTPAVPGSCLMTAVIFNDATTTDGVNAISQWSWNYGDGVSQTLTAPPFQHTYNAAGVYSVSLAVTDAAGCTDSIYKNNLLVISMPAADFATPDTISCPASPVNFTNLSTGPGLTYNWDFGDGNTSTSASPVHSYSTTGIYNIQLTITDQYGCVSILSKPAYIHIVNPQAAFTVSDSVSTCPPLIVQFTNTSANQVSYNWDFGDGTFSNAVSPSHFYNVAGTYVSKLTITGAGGCTSFVTKTIVVRGPRGTFSYSPLTGCSPLTVNFVAATQDRTSFIWDFNDGSTVSTTDSLISHIYTIPGIYVPKMILRDAAGCTVPIIGSDTISVNGVIASFTADTLLRCSGGNVTFTNNTASNDLITGYLWDFGDGNTSTQSAPVHFYGAEGNFTVTLHATTQLGCVDSITSILPVKVVRTPQIDITTPPNGCVPLSLSLNGNLLNSDTSAISWQWNLSNGSTATGQNFNALTFPNAGTYTCTLYAVNSSGCRDTATASFEAYPLPSISAGNDIAICQGTGQNITATGGATYTWSPSAGLSCTTCASPVAIPNVQTDYYVTGVSAQGCINKDTVQVKVRFPFTMQKSPGDTLCVGQSAVLSASGAFTYAWSPSAGLSSTTTATVNARPDTTTRYMLVGSDQFGCFKDTAYFPVKVYPYPVVSAGADITINVGQTITLIPTLSPDVTNVVWSPSTGIVSSVYPTVSVKPDETRKYKITATNAGGCSSDAAVTVYVLCNGANVFIPNTFSPNADGANDVFYPRGTGLFSIKVARVFNRWGEVVYEKNDFKANNETAGWNGTYKGQPLAPDVFIYMFEILCDNNTTLVYKGNIALIR